jgi:hypothetical protein
MKGKAKDRLEAEVLLRPAAGAQDEEWARAAGASSEVIEKVTRKLKDLGFEVTAEGAISISVSGPKELFERLGKGEQGSVAEGLTVPEDLSEHVEGIYIQSRPTYHDT